MPAPTRDPGSVYRAGRERASTSPNKKEAEAYKRPTQEDLKLAYYTTLDNNENAPGFASVAAAFEFVHHVGSDPAKELQVLKCILIREGFVGQLATTADELTAPSELATPAELDALSATMLDLLAQTRDASVAVVESVVRWREGSADAPPPVFFWQKVNYLLKMCTDLNYLAEVDTLLAMLNVKQVQVGGVGSACVC